MKKLFTILLVSFLAVNTSVAQVEGQGTVILGAYTELSNTAWSQAVVTPNIGYFLSDQFVVGLGLSINSSTDEDELTGFNTNTGNTEDYTVTNSVFNMTIAPWMRLYLNEMFFVNASVAIGSGSDKMESSDSDLSGWTDSDGDQVSEMVDKQSSFGLNVGAGASILWGDYLAFEPMFGFTMGSSSDTPFDQDTEKGPSTIGLGFKIGICVMLGN